MTILAVIAILERAAAAGIDLFAIWKKANAAIEDGGIVNEKAYQELVAECDTQIIILQKNAREASSDGG